jgi:predicted SprT family Zn-dependent metalloprotease
MLVPPIALRRDLDRRLVLFFRNQKLALFRQAITDFCRYYAVKPARIEWFQYIDWGKAAGKTFEDGRIHLIHPENWKRGRIYKSERMWVETVYHELAHYLFWTDAERKAEEFTLRMVRGLRRPDKPRLAIARRRGLQHLKRRATTSGRNNSTRLRSSGAVARRRRSSKAA